MEKSIFSHGYTVFLQVLRDTREQQGLTQIELAERLGQTQSFISKCERGERRLDIVEVRAFCNALGVPFTKFIASFESNLEKSK